MYQDINYLLNLFPQKYHIEIKILVDKNESIKKYFKEIKYEDAIFKFIYSSDALKKTVAAKEIYLDIAEKFNLKNIRGDLMMNESLNYMFGYMVLYAEADKDFLQILTKIIENNREIFQSFIEKKTLSTEENYFVINALKLINHSSFFDILEQKTGFLFNKMNDDLLQDLKKEINDEKPELIASLVMTLPTQKKQEAIEYMLDKTDLGLSMKVLHELLHNSPRIYYHICPINFEKVDVQKIEKMIRWSSRNIFCHPIPVKTEEAVHRLISQVDLEDIYLLCDILPKDKHDIVKEYMINVCHKNLLENDNLYFSYTEDNMIEIMKYGLRQCRKKEILLEQIKEIKYEYELKNMPPDVYFLYISTLKDFSNMKIDIEKYINGMNTCQYEEWIDDIKNVKTVFLYIKNDLSEKQKNKFLVQACGIDISLYDEFKDISQLTTQEKFAMFDNWKKNYWRIKNDFSEIFLNNLIHQSNIDHVFFNTILDYANSRIYPNIPIEIQHYIKNNLENDIINQSLNDTDVNTKKVRRKL